jgi:hypothetical protein
MAELLQDVVGFHDAPQQLQISAYQGKRRQEEAQRKRGKRSE